MTHIPAIDGLMDTIFPPDAHPVACTCGRAPKLEQNSHLSWYECRRWFGLKLCRRGPVVFEGWSDGDYARRAAARAWNRELGWQGPVRR